MTDNTKVRRIWMNSLARKGTGIEVVPAADYDALAKRVEEAEARHANVHDPTCRAILQTMADQRDRALAVVEAARPHAHCYGGGTLADALADFDKEEK